MPLCPPIRPPFPRPARRHRARGGFSVLEASIAGAIIMVFLTSLFALNSNMMHLLGSAAQAANASQSLQQRVEQVRLANWQQISDPAWVQSQLFGKMTDASVNLAGLKETITVSAYYAPSSVAPNPNPGSFIVTRSPAGAVTVSPAGFASSALLSQEMLQVDLAVTWPGWNRTRYRGLTTLVSRWGISK